MMSACFASRSWGRPFSWRSAFTTSSRAASEASGLSIEATFALP